MPSPGQAVAEKPNVTPQEAVMFKAPQSELKRLTVIPDESLKKLSELEEFEEKGETGKDILEAMQTVGPTFTSEDRDSFVSRFAAGNVVKEGGVFKIEDDANIPDEFKPRAEQSLRTAERLSSETTTVARYLEIQGAMQRAGDGDSTKGEPIVLRERSLSPGEWTSLKKQALGTLGRSRFFRDILPNIRALPEDERRIFVEATLANDPKLRNFIVDKITAIDNESKALPEVTEDSEYKEAKDNKTNAEARIEESVTRLSQSLEGEGIILDDTQKENMLRQVRQGRSADVVLRSLQRNLLNESHIPGYNNIQKLIELRNQAQQLETKLAGIKVGAPERQFHVDELEVVRGQLSPLESNFKNNPQAIEKYNAISPLLSTQRDGGVYVSALAQEVDTIVKAQQDVAKEDKKIKATEKKAKKKSSDQWRERLRKEEELNRKLEGVVSDSISDVVIDRMNKALELDRKRIEKKQGETKNKALEAVGEAIKNRYITHDKTNRRRKINRDEIRDDMRFIVTNGEEGIKRLILRELREKDFKIYPEGVSNPSSWWEEGKLSDLKPEQIAQLNQAYEAHGNALREKLFTSYFVARRPTDIAIGNSHTLGGGEYALTNDEWRLMQQNFGDAIDKGLASSKAAQDVLKKLQGKGIAPTFKMKWLMWLLLMGAGAAGLAVGGPVALAAGAGLFKEGSGFVRGQLG